jgi:hypothetical protein
VVAGDAALARASHHGTFWGLYFDTARGRLALLAVDLRVDWRKGGPAAFAAPPAPAGRLALPV